MSPIITQPAVPAQAHPVEAARKRAERLARATAGQAEAALAFLSVIDPLAFEIAMDAADLAAGQTPSSTGTPGNQAPEDEEAIPVCRHCAGQVGIFLDHGLEWQHYLGDSTTSGAQEIYDPGHPAEVTWTLPGEGPEDQ